MQIKTKSFWVPKKGNTIEEYEDAFSFTAETEGNSNVSKIAVADGASEGFFSKTWADILVKNFCRNKYKTFNQYLEHCNQDWKEWKQNYLDERKENNRPIQWFEEEGIRRGAFSTFIGIIVNKKRLNYNLIALGDSCLFHIRDNTLFQSYPLIDSDSFNNRPILLSSENSLTQEIQKEIFLKKDINFLGTDKFFLMTDALALWFFKELEIGNNPIEILEAISIQDEFIASIEMNRDNQNLHNDDVTFLSISCH